MKRLAAIATALVWHNTVLPGLGLGPRGATAANALFATGFHVAFRDRPVQWVTRRGVRLGAAAAVVPIAGFAVALAVPQLRRRLARPSRDDFAEWVLVHIPIGTVYTEELIFRGTISTLGGWPGPIAFGLWHIAPARAAGENVAGTVAFTTAAGFLFDTLAARGGSLAAPALLHLATNVGGAVCTLVADGKVEEL